MNETNTKNGNNSEFEKINKIEWWGKKRKKWFFLCTKRITYEDGK